MAIPSPRSVPFGFTLPFRCSTRKPVKRPEKRRLGVGPTAHQTLSPPTKRFSFEPHRILNCFLFVQPKLEFHRTLPFPFHPFFLVGFHTFRHEARCDQTHPSVEFAALLHFVSLASRCSQANRHHPNQSVAPFPDTESWSWSKRCSGNMNRMKCM